MGKKFTWMVTLLVIAALVLPAPVSAAAGDITGKILGVASTVQVTLTAESEGHAGCQANRTGSGTFTLNGCEQGFEYTVTPTAAGYTFSPASKVVITGANTVNAGSFSAVIQKFAVTGTITTGNPPAGLSGVLVKLGKYSATTNAAGTYTIANVPYGTTGKVTPFRSGFVFAPPTQDVTVTGAVSGVDFSALRAYTITGRVMLNGRGLSGVTVQFGALTAVTGASGAYLLRNVPEGTSGDLVPGKAGYTFTPDRIPLTVSGNLTGQNFTAAVVTKTISGTVTGLNPADTVQIFYGPGKTMFVTTEAGTGAYTIPNLPANKDYRLLPVATKYLFDPKEIIVPAGAGDATNQNFTAMELVILSGQVTVQGRAVRGVLITATANGQEYKTLTDARGMYLLRVPKGVEVSLAAAHRFFTFTPPTPTTPSGDYTVNWETASVTVTGRVVELNGPAMASVTIAAGTATATTNGNGEYTLNVTATDVPNLFAFRVVPQPAPGFQFRPKARPVSVSLGKTNVNFIAIRQTFLINGRVTVNGTGVPGVRVSSGKYFSYTSGAGVYTIRGVPFGTNITPKAYRFGYSFTGPDPFVMPTQNVTGMDFTGTVLPRIRTISGNVFYGQANTPLPGVLMKLTYQNLPLGATTTAADGHYAFRNLVPDNGFTIQPFKTNYIFVPLGPVIVSTSTADATVNFRAMRVAAVTGVISGLPAGTQAVFTVTGNSGSSLQKTVTIERGGRYTLPQLVEDTYTMSVQIQGYQINPPSTNFTIDQTTGSRVIRNFTATKITP